VVGDTKQNATASQSQRNHYQELCLKVTAKKSLDHQLNNLIANITNFLRFVKLLAHFSCTLPESNKCAFAVFSILKFYPEASAVWQA
jgi:hypothetical protein